MKHVFVSHKVEDAQRAHALVSTLEEAGIPCWIAPRNIPHGAPWPREIVHAIKTSGAVLVVVTRKLLSGETQILREVSMADDAGIPIVPVFMEATSLPEGLGFFLVAAHQCHMHDRDWSSGLASLIQLLQGNDHGLSNLPPAAHLKGQHTVGPYPRARIKPLWPWILAVAALVSALLAIHFVWANGRKSVLAERRTGTPTSTRDAAAIRMSGMGAMQSEDYAQALSFFREAAELGDTTAMMQLGYLYYIGQGVAKDEAQAVSFFRKAADLGDTTAMRQLGYLYYYGQGVTEDEQEAESWFQRASTKGDAPAKRELENLHQVWKERKQPGGRSPGAEFSASIRGRAERGEAEAQFEYAISILNRNESRATSAEGLQWLRKAADQGQAKAMNELGLCYLRGIGVAADKAKAREWIEKAAATGLEAAQNNLQILDQLGVK